MFPQMMLSLGICCRGFFLGADQSPPHGRELRQAAGAASKEGSLTPARMYCGVRYPLLGAGWIILTYRRA